MATERNKTTGYKWAIQEYRRIMATNWGSVAATVLIASTLAACGSARAEGIADERDSATASPETTGVSQDVVGRWHADLPDTDTYQELVLNKDHKISGYDGCNQVVGTWAADSAGQDVVSVAIDLQTYKACPKLSAADLGKAATAVVVDGRLRLLDGSGSLVTSL